MDSLDDGVRGEKKISLDRRKDCGIVSYPAIGKGLFYPLDDVLFPDDILQIQIAPQSFSDPADNLYFQKPTPPI